jgi:hypothetical protein
MTSSQCSTLSLASNICTLLCCYFLAYTPIKATANLAKQLPPFKTPFNLLLIMCCVCSCMSSQVLTLASCGFNMLKGESYESKKIKYT